LASDIERELEFERYDKRTAPIGGVPFVTIQRSGPMSINKAAYELLGEPEAVELLYSRKNRAIGLRKVSKKEPYAFAVRPQGRKGRKPSNYLVAIQAFAKHYDIDTSVAMRYPAEMKDDVLVIELDRGAVATGLRAKQRGDAKS
jgi:hypothetical protein